MSHSRDVRLPRLLIRLFCISVNVPPKMGLVQVMNIAR